MPPCRSLGQSARLNQLYPDWLELHIGVRTVLGTMPVARPGQRTFVYNKFSMPVKNEQKYLSGENTDTSVNTTTTTDPSRPFSLNISSEVERTPVGDLSSNYEKENSELDTCQISLEVLSKEEELKLSFGAGSDWVVTDTLVYGVSYGKLSW